MPVTVHPCPECGNGVRGRRKQFCCAACRLAWNNRRLQRGAEIYDLFRAIRRERDEAKRLRVWTEICRLEFRWQAEDDAQRPGRRSYVPPARALANLYDRGSLPRGEVLVRPYLSGKAAAR